MFNASARPGPGARGWRLGGLLTAGLAAVTGTALASPGTAASPSSMAGMGNPALLAGPAAATARIIAHDVVAWNAAFATIQLALAAGLLSFVLAGAGVVWGVTARPALVLAVLIAMFIWVAGEDFGGVLTGHATDPDSGPLLILLAAAFWPQRRAPSPGQPRRGAISHTKVTVALRTAEQVRVTRILALAPAAPADEHGQPQSPGHGGHAEQHAPGLLPWPGRAEQGHHGHEGQADPPRRVDPGIRRQRHASESGRWWGSASPPGRLDRHPELVPGDQAGRDNRGRCAPFGLAEQADGLATDLPSSHSFS